MALTENEKQRIKDEESYRSKIRDDLKKEEKQERKRKNSWGCGILLLILFSPVLLLMFIDTSKYKERARELEKQSSTSTNSELLGNVHFDGSNFNITNEDIKDWTHCRFTLNNEYYYPSYKSALEVTYLDKISMEDTLKLGFGAFTLPDGTRFNAYQTAPQDMSIGCNEGFSYWSW